MRARYRAAGGVEISLPPWATLEVYDDPPRRELVVEERDYEELRDQILAGDIRRAELERERDELRAQHAKAMGDAAYWRHAWEEDKGPVLDELKAVIVSQAREIARLRGEGE